MNIKTIFSIAALAFAMAAPVTFTATPALAEGTPFCHSKALNGETIDPPVCNAATAHKGSAGEGGYVIPGRVCSATVQDHCSRS